MMMKATDYETYWAARNFAIDAWRIPEAQRIESEAREHTGGEVAMRPADYVEEGRAVWEVAGGEVWRANGLWWFGTASGDASVIEATEAKQLIEETGQK